MPNHAFDANATHTRFIEVADGLSPDLAEDLRFVGPVEFPDRRDMGIFLFLSRTVISQQISTHAAASIWGKFEALMATNGNDPVFLHPRNTDALRACGLSGNKVKTLIAIGDAMTGGHLSAENLDALPVAKRCEKLLGIWGIGQWTCDMASIFFFSDADIWPEGDVAVQKTFRRYLGRKKPTKAAARFAPQRSVLALYMWQIVHRMP